jgi:hypothetical protein
VIRLVMALECLPMAKRERTAPFTTLRRFSFTQITIQVTIEYVIATDERTKSRSSIITDGENTYGYNSQT